MSIILIAIPIVSAILSKGWFLLAFEPIMIPCATEMLCRTFEYIRMIEVKRRENNERE